MPKLYWLSAFFLLIFSTFILLDKLLPIPSLANEDNTQQFAKVIVAQDGTPLRAFADHKGVWRYPVQLHEVSPRYIDTLLAYEDRWFWYHPGVNPLAIIRAAGQNLLNGRVISGGSTLTMQVARILDPHSRSIAGKLKQIFRALQLEWHYSKTEILTLYLNRAPFGGTIEGVQAASFAYLSKSVAELSLAEAALLSVLPQSPSRFRPDRHPQRAEQARNKVLQRLYQFAQISLAELNDARLEIVVPQLQGNPMLAPILARRLKSRAVSHRPLKTTIDADLQANLETLVRDYSHQLAGRNSAAVLVVNHHTMAVKAYIASADFYDTQRYGQVDMIRALRSPGSTLKPFLYALALDQGLLSSHSMLRDEVVNISGYKPQNFTAHYSGKVSMSEALQRSLNIPAIQVLQFLGPGYFHAALENAGLYLKMPGRSRANLAIVLGGAGARLEELVSAYTAFSRGGRAGQLRFTKDESLVENYLMSAGAAWIIREILSGIPRRSGLSQMISHGIDKNSLIAWKTGTSYGFRDAWAIGMTANYTIGIWTGRPDGTPVPGHYGTQTAVPLLKSVSLNLPSSSSDTPGSYQPRPKSVTQAVICWPGGRTVAETEAEHCKNKHLSWILDNTFPAPLTRDPRLETVFNELKITSLDNNAQLRNPPDSQQDLSVNLQAQGGSGALFWFVNGQPVNRIASRAVMTYRFAKSGQYLISAVDQMGQSDQIALMVQL